MTHQSADVTTLPNADHQKSGWNRADRHPDRQHRMVVVRLHPGRASGVALLAAAQMGVECFSYTPQAIKKAVCGSGSAGKKQVQRMVGTLLGLSEMPRPDHAADALAPAICHGGTVPFGAATEAATGGAPGLRVAS